jgi:hypothetical protein
MRIPSKRVLIILTTVVAVFGAAPGLAWLSLTHTPTFYRARIAVPPEERQAEARKFVAQSMQLRNDIANEPNWEAVFSDAEVNAWLAEDLVTHFADQIPPGIHEPRVVFEMDRVTLAFGLDQGGVRSIVWVVARPRVPGPNVLELTLEKIRAGMLPIPAEQVLDRITAHARARGLDVSWKRDGEDHLPVATIRYKTHAGRDDVCLERLHVINGEIHLAGRSDRARGAVASPTLPSRRMLQSRFPRQNSQSSEPPPATASRNSTKPAN